MKIISIIYIILFSCLVRAQPEWTDPFETSFSINSDDKFESYSDSYGIHMVINQNGNLRYLRFNTSGGLEANLLLDNNCENSNNTSTIVGYDDMLYVVYQKGTEMKITTSTNHGSSWNSGTIVNFTILNSNCNGIDACADSKGLFVVWGIKIGQYYETYYNRYNWLQEEWQDFKNVTDFTAFERGGRPSVTTSENKAHVAYNISSSDPIGLPSGAKTRDYNFITQQWEVPQNIYILEFPSPPVEGASMDDQGTLVERISSNDGYLHIVLYEYVLFYPVIYYYLYHKKRPVNSTTWDPEDFLTYDITDPARIVKPVFTSDGNMHIIYYEGPGYFEPRRLRHSYYSLATGWQSPIDVSNLNFDFIMHYCLSAVSNDLYAFWLYYFTSTYPTMFYSHFDENPLTPANFAGLFYNNHPKLIWILNNEPDIVGYEIYRLITGGSGVFELITTVSSGTSSFFDTEIQLGGPTAGKVFYKIRAKDNYPNFSAYTNVIIYAYSGLNKLSFINNSVEYELFSNYPNPFNPSTQIRYSLAQDAFVTLKVYDMLGTEVAELINETQTAGNHTVNFNADNLSSGVYIYHITASNNGRILFTDSKQMILLR